jgi:hypothetical protein
MEKEYILGKVKGKTARLIWNLTDGNFAMQATLGNEMVGQCVNEVVDYFPTDQKAQRMREVWKNWHLNDLTAGSPAQRDYLSNHRTSDTKLTHYERALKLLAEAGLNPDPNYLHKGKPYEYGSAWLKRTIPEDIIKEIESW